MKMDIWNAVQQYMPLLIEMRRYFHCHPELSWKEDHTMAYIEKRLDEFGISYHLIEKGGILGHIDGTAPGKTLLIRADMDALPIDETDHNLSQPRVCRSSVPGVMHACGHDGHMAMQLIVAKLLQNLRHQWDGTVLILFEQGEEDSHAMEYIVPYLERTLTQKIDCAYATHVRWDVPTGKIAILDPSPMAGGFRFRIALHGKGGHGSRPDLAYNPIDCFASIHMQLQQLRLRAVSPQECLSVSVGSVHSGELQNVIPNTLEFAGTCRFLNYDNAGAPFFNEFMGLVERECQNYHCTYDVIDMPKPLYEVHNDATCAALARNAVIASLGKEALYDCPPWMASETFSILTRLYPSVLVFTGIANEAKGTGANHHTPQFDLDEDGLAYGAAAGLAFALTYLKEKPSIPFIRHDEPLEELAARNV